MSRVGKMPIAVPAGVTVEIAENNKVTVKGPKGTLERVLPAEMEIKQEGAEITVTRPNDLKRSSPATGSSSSSSRPVAQRARARSTRCCCPPESSR